MLSIGLLTLELYLDLLLHATWDMAHIIIILRVNYYGLLDFSKINYYLVIFRVD